ncbi:hypothetical protein [Priestia endophytica]|jgi:hypothetical protein|uniref:hypothetical protein n=1 Tax=Priestia endophytica TaxID=135735 RepID=UPI00124C4BAC|nr:hypothetical protein [Priestia endophytica]KAB2493423.1 hypothetical protein F8155_14065 [Priestia endophytica]
MRGKPELEIKTDKVYKTKKNSNGMFIARIIQVPKEEKMLGFILVIENLKKKQIYYEKLLVTKENHYYSFRLARGDLKWVSLNTVAVWDNLGHKLVEVSAPTGKEFYRISDEHCSAYREKQ